jgi:hypothetical protein
MPGVCPVKYIPAAFRRGKLFAGEDIIVFIIINEEDFDLGVYHFCNSSRRRR